MKLYILYLIAVLYLSIISYIITADASRKPKCPPDFDEKHPYDIEKLKLRNEKIKASEDSGIKASLLQASLFASPPALTGAIEDIKEKIKELQQAQTIYTIPIVFNIITSSTVPQPVPLAALQANIDMMNKGYSGKKGSGDHPDTGIRFSLQGVYVYKNDAWFKGCGTAKGEKAMKSATAKDPARYINVWICYMKNWYGYAAFGNDYPENSYFHGVVLNYLALTKVDGYKPYDDANEGGTLLHEVGHFFGLEHTFKGRCSTVGDGMSDTPAEYSAAFGPLCTKNPPRDTCPRQPGVDPVKNYMDYTDDFCLEEFTPLQVAAMRLLLTEDRPTMKKNQGRECVTSGTVGTEGPWKICVSDCIKTTTPDGQAAPSTGWCKTSTTDASKWGKCCCVEAGCTPGANIYGTA